MPSSGWSADPVQAGENADHRKIATVAELIEAVGNGTVRFGEGSRGFNVYDGLMRSVEFERVVTRADGSVGIQVSRPVGEIRVRRGIETHGGRGRSLVKGVVVELPAIALSVKPGGSIGRVQVLGGLVTHGSGIEALELHGRIGELEISGGFEAAAGGFD
jgi:hypothetical protein